MLILGHHCVAILLAKMLIWTLFPQSMCTFSSCINPVFLVFCFNLAILLCQIVGGPKKTASVEELSKFRKMIIAFRSFSYNN